MRLIERFLLPLIESTTLTLFFVQALRLVISDLYRHISSASLSSTLPSDRIDSSIPGFITQEAVLLEIGFLGILILAPLISQVIGHWKWTSIFSGVLVAIFRYLMIPNTPFPTTLAAQIVVAFGLVYIATIILRDAKRFPYMFILAIACDQLYRSIGNTMDISLASDYSTIQFVLALITIVFVLFNNLKSAHLEKKDQGKLNIWAGIALGGMLFIEFSLLALPNAIAGRSDGDYTILVPLTLVATLLPIIPVVQDLSRKFISLFDNVLRGWIWLIIMALLLIIGIRIQTLTLGDRIIPIGSFALVFVQFMLSLSFWWYVKPQVEKERNFTGVALIFTTVVFGILFFMDLMTYEYAFIRNFAAPFESLNAFLPTLLRGFRGLGILVILLAIFLAIIPLIQGTLRIPWKNAPIGFSIVTTLFIAVLAFMAYTFSAPPIVQSDINPEEIRIGTYNIHNGMSEFYGYDLEEIAKTIKDSGAKIVLIQEIDKGRLTSMGIDQTLWLARRLKYDVRYYPTNESLTGLAILSNLPIAFDDGLLLTSEGMQTGLQRAQILIESNNVITIYNTWLGLLVQGESVEEQERIQRIQLNETLSNINQHIQTDYNKQPGRLVLGGTFNNVPDSPLIQTVLQNGFNDSFAGTNPGLSATLVRTLIEARVDYLFTLGQSLPITGTGVFNSSASDHRLAFAGYQLQR